MICCFRYREAFSENSFTAAQCQHAAVMILCCTLPVRFNVETAEEIYLQGHFEVQAATVPLQAAGAATSTLQLRSSQAQ